MVSYNLILIKQTIMKNYFLLQSEEIPTCQSKEGIFSNSDKNELISSKFCRSITTLLFVFLFFGTASWAQPVIDGLAGEWPAAFNNGSVIAKSFVRDADNTNDDQFTNGSQDPDLMSNWAWSIGNTNNKGNISNAGAIFQGSKIYFFGDRTSINGDASIGFWFFKNGGSPLSGGTFSGSHVIGDLLIVSDFTNGGGVATIKIYTWNGTGVTLIGTSTNARVNSSPIPIPTYTNPDNGHTWSYLETMYPTGAFFEGFIDLADLGITDRCFTNFLLETRNSQSINASLQDFVAGAFNVTPLPPTAPPVVVCIGQPISLRATCSSNGNLTIRWYTAASGGSPIATGSPFVPTGTPLGTYYVTCYNAAVNCESVRVPVTVTVNPLPTVSVNSGSRCISGTNSAAVTLIATTNAANPSYLWSPGGATTASISVSPNSTTLYTVTVTNGTTGCFNSGSGTVTVNPLPTVSVNSGARCISGTNSAAVTLIATTNAANPSYSWNPGGATSSSISVSPNSTTPYTATVTNGTTGCSNSSSGTVTVNPLPTVSVNSGARCISGTNSAAVLLTATTNAANPSYSWNPGGATSSSISVSPNSTTPYTATVTNGTTGCSNSGSGTVTVNPLPTVSVNSGARCISGTNSAAVTLIATTNAANPSYSWNPGGATSSSISVSPNSTTPYTATVTNGTTGCSNSGSGTVTVNPLPTVSVNSGARCISGTNSAAVTLIATTNAANPSYSWNPGGATSSSISVSPNSTTPYTATVTDGTTGCSNSGSGTVTVNPLPTVSVNSGARCISGTNSAAVTLIATTNAANPTYSWNPGGATSSSISVSPSTTTIYTATVTNGITSCSNSGSGTVTVNPLPTVSVNSGARCISGANSAAVSLTANTNAANPTYLWNPGGATSASISVSPTTTTIYTATVTNGITGCSNSGSGTVTVNPLPPAPCPGDSLFNEVDCGVSAAVAQAATNSRFQTWFAQFGVLPAIYQVQVGYVYTPASAQPLTGRAPLNPILGVPGNTQTSVTVTWTITDVNTGCQSSCSATFRITYNCSINCSNLSTNVLCKGASTGSITVNAQGGTPPYAVNLYKLPNTVTPYRSETGLNTSAISVLFDSLPAGSYDYLVTDASSVNNCNNNAPIVLSEPAAALDLLALGKTDVTCSGPNTGTIIATFSGGTAPYMLKLDGDAPFAATSPYTFTGVTAGAHTVRVFDANYATSPLAGCTDQESVTVEPPVCGGHIFPTQTTCCNYVSGSATELINVCTKDKSKTDEYGPAVDVAVPGVFFYYSYVTAPSANFTIELRQTKGTNLNRFFTIQGYPSNLSQIRLTSETCGSVIFTPSFIDSGRGARYVITGATPGARYVVSVKYDTKSIEGGLYAGTPYRNTYTFRSWVGPAGGTLVADATSEGNIDALSGCTDNTPLPGACTLTAKIDGNSVSANTLASTENVGFEVYPVPFTDQLTIRYTYDYKSNVKVVISDILGRVVMTYDDKKAYFGKEVTLHPEFTRIAGSMYFITVTSDRGNETKKIISGK
jgi:hypothetical protein